MTLTFGSLFELSESPVLVARAVGGVFEAMQARVRATLLDLQVAQKVVGLVLVNVVNSLVREQAPADVQLHDAHMLEDIAATAGPRVIGRIGAHVAVIIQAETAAPGGMIRPFNSSQARGSNRDTALLAIPQQRRRSDPESLFDIADARLTSSIRTKRSIQLFGCPRWLAACVFHVANYTANRLPNARKEVMPCHAR